MQDLAERLAGDIAHSIGDYVTLRITISNWELADRPSLRLIARIITVSRFNNYPIGWEFRSIGSRENLASPESPWRRVFLANFCAYTGAEARVSHAPIPLLCEDTSAAATALVDMNWDLLIPTPGDFSTSSAELRLQHALALANVGANLEVLEILTGILNGDDLSTTFLAHAHYLRGLLQTKRLNQSRAALDTFGQGVEVLRDPTSEAEAVVLGWLKNGIALAKCTLYLQATAPESAERARYMMEIFEEEAQVYQNLAGNQEAAYLRYNILANMGFLLELAHDYKSALRFWSTAFPETATGAIAYRKGILQMKAGLHAESAVSLEAALEDSRRSGNVFHRAQESYALAYLSANSGALDEEYLKQGHEDAARLGDLNLMRKFSKLKGAKADQQPDFPASKLISYVPYAELDSETDGTENFNNVLLNTERNSP